MSPLTESTQSRQLLLSDCYTPDSWPTQCHLPRLTCSCVRPPWESLQTCTSFCLLPLFIPNAGYIKWNRWGESHQNVFLPTKPCKIIWMASLSKNSQEPIRLKNDFHKNSTLSFTPFTLVLSQVYGGVFQMCDHHRLNAEADMRIKVSPIVI